MDYSHEIRKGNYMKKIIVFWVACLLLLLAGCNATASTETRTISDSTYVLSADMREALNAQLEAYLNFDINEYYVISEPELWSYAFNEDCAITVSQVEDRIDTEKNLFCTLLYRENGTWHAKQFGEDSVLLVSPSNANPNAVCDSFVQRVGNITIICLGEADSIVQRFGDVKPEDIFDSRNSTKLLMSFAALYENGTDCNWTQAIKNEDSEYSFLSSVVYTDCPFGYIIAVPDMENAYTLTCGKQSYSGAEIESLLRDFSKRAD